jgi:hypothetical protein
MNEMPCFSETSLSVFAIRVQKESYDLDSWSHEHILPVFKPIVTIEVVIIVWHRQCHSDDSQ